MQPGWDSASSRAAMLTPSDVAEMHAHAELERSIAFRRMGLPAKRAFDGIDHAGEFGQIAVAHTLDDAALVLGDGRFDDASLKRLQQFQRARLIRAHQTRIAHQVCIEHCGETTFHRTLRSARRPSGKNPSYIAGYFRVLVDDTSFVARVPLNIRDRVATLAFQ